MAKYVEKIWNLPRPVKYWQTVGIYARVSTHLTSQLQSMSFQVSALTQQVFRRPNWSLADVYMDFSSGKNAAERAEFQRLLSDCRAHKIDLVLTKSVSRFGRDTVDGLQATRELKDLDIPVYFELEEINSLQPDFELYFSIYSAVAQGERENTRDNIVMAINHKILDGTSEIYARPCYGYKKTEDGTFVIVPEEAENVRLVFRLYLEGKSIIGIIRELEKRRIASPTGKTTWCRRSIDTMLSNEKYRGGAVATTALMSYDPKKKQRSRYLFSNHHEAIIEQDIFDAVVEEKRHRCNIEGDENGIHRKKSKYSSKRRLATLD